LVRKHHLYSTQPLRCDNCRFQSICSKYQAKERCYYESEAIKDWESTEAKEELLLDILGKEMIRLITRLGIAAKEGEINYDIHTRVLAQVIAYLKLRQKFMRESARKQRLSDLLVKENE